MFLIRSCIYNYFRIYYFPYINSRYIKQKTNMNALTLFKALSDRIRLTCVLLIRSQQELCVCELVTAVDDIQPKISRHLALLKKQGVLCDRKQGQWVFYFINPALPHWFKEMLDQLLLEPQHYQIALERLNNMGNRPERQSRCC